MIKYTQKVRFGVSMIIYQTENMGNRFEYRTSGHDNWVKPPHIHEYSELALVTDGVATIYLSGKKYLVEPGHAILILPNLVHEYTDETPSHLQCAVFSNDHIPAFFEAVGNGELECPIVDLTDEPFLQNEILNAPVGNSVRLSGMLNLLFDKALSSTTVRAGENDSESLLKTAVIYISENFKRDIKLKDLSRTLGYHEKYLSSVLHDLTGMNFRRFLASYRVEYAKYLLRSKENSAMRIHEISSECGFTSMNSFNRIFHELTGKTPSEYRSRGMVK